MKELSEGVWKEKDNILTVNLTPGVRVYGEQLVQKEGKEFRVWDPTRSKLGAAIANGFKPAALRQGAKVLYLGAASGTTVSHVSDIVGKEGLIYAIEFSERPFRDLQTLAKHRRNIAPILADARKPETYAWVEQVDAVFVDVAQPDETELSMRNASAFLMKGGFLMIAIKSQSIDVTKPPEQVYKEEAAKLKAAGYKVVEKISLEPYETAHALIVAEK
jgi:fibrillarin-like pre-rRNA processing protein